MYRAFLLLLAATIIVLDQLSKWWIVSTISPGGYVYPIPVLAPFVGLTHVQNTGVAFGLFQNANTFFAPLSMVVIVVIVRFMRALPADRWLARLGLTLLLAGAIGNLIDRLRVGYVIDFVAVGSFARFNVADSAVSIGVAVLVLAWLLEHRQESAARAASDPAPGAREHEETHI